MVLTKAKYVEIPGYISCMEVGIKLGRSKDGVKQTAERLGLPLFYLKSGSRKALTLRVTDVPKLSADWERIQKRGKHGVA